MQLEQSLPKKKRKRRKKRFPNRRNSAKHFKDWANIGREVLINGKNVRVYTRGKLVEAFASAGVPKTSTTLRNWEKAGVLPKSPIMIGGKYYYTRKMIETIVLTYIETGQGVYVTSSERFKSELQSRLDKVIREELC